MEYRKLTKLLVVCVVLLSVAKLYFRNLGANGILVEYEDMFPYEGKLEILRSPFAYSEKDIEDIGRLASLYNLELIPLVQVFGHLEFVLKHEEFFKLREIANFPNSLNPLHSDSLKLVKEMLTQVLKKHPQTKWFHIGADEVSPYFVTFEQYDHYAVLCELLPVAIPSLATCLATLKHGSFNQLAEKEVEKYLGCKTDLKANTCKGYGTFPGFEIYDMIKKIHEEFQKSTETVIQNYYLRGYFSSYQRKYNFANPRFIEYFKDPLINNVATESEPENDMTEENNNTAESLTGQTEHDNIITIQTTLGDEDEDIHKCGRCGEEFSALDIFIQHKISRICKRPSQNTQVIDDEDGELVNNAEISSLEKEGVGLTTSNVETRNSAKDHGESENKDCSDSTKSALKPNEEGRYVCHICEKTFKTANILRTHLSIHTDRKDFKCDLCETAFRTKGSLIRHNRRHTDERPYQCSQCGLSFRESGALTRHLKSLTPCTEKIRYSQCKEILFSKNGICTEVQQPPILPEEEPQQPVVSVVQTVQDSVHIQVVEDLGQIHQPVAETVAGDSLICQAIINSGIALETKAVEAAQQAEVKLPKEVLQNPEAESRVPVIQVTEECVEVEAETVDRETSALQSHKCPQCDRAFRTASHLRIHIKGHAGYKPFKCVTCQKEFLTGYTLKKHMEMHLTERRYKCGECGKLFKSIGHNALQVHQRTHGEDKPYACPHCSRAFREKGALVRHIRHHTGEKPFKCSKCGRGFAEHGTLNRHLRSKGGCTAEQELKSEPLLSSEKQEHIDSMAAAIITDDPHAVLVEFSSVADTQEYIIGTSAEETAQPEVVSITPDNNDQLDSQIIKVVQQVVSQAHGGQQIIVRNVEANEKPGVFDTGDTITIATPESLTEQVAITLASAISNGSLLNSTSYTEGTSAVEQDEHYVITSSDEMEIQTVVVV
ncbi:Transcription factor E4F1 [Bagarius yarrelli]|uniref:Transcription factor E4F1 n=1 Tax=Bagarius yarrelli TaxID=175774 RepID=A0A556UEJ6_BAGYA|nr:Transcription factor E4F1 [Bagarius yarrelli]